MLSVEYFSAACAAAALLFTACVVCVATAALHACAFPRILTLDVVCHLSVIDWMVAHQCRVWRGSRIAFEVVEEEAKATPRVDVAETPKDLIELEKPECRLPVFVRTFSGTRTLYASSSMLVSDFILLVSQSTAVPETSFYLTFQGTLPLGGHTIGEVGIGRDASLAMRGRLLGGANKRTSCPQYHEWYCVRCQRGGC